MHARSAMEEERWDDSEAPTPPSVPPVRMMLPARAAVPHLGNIRTTVPSGPSPANHTPTAHWPPQPPPPAEWPTRPLPPPGVPLVSPPRRQSLGSSAPSSPTPHRRISAADQYWPQLTTQTEARNRTRVHMRTCARVHARLHTRRNARGRNNTHTRAHTRKLVHAHTHVRTRTHTKCAHEMHTCTLV